MIGADVPFCERAVGLDLLRKAVNPARNQVAGGRERVSGKFANPASPAALAGCFSMDTP